MTSTGDWEELQHLNQSDRTQQTERDDAYPTVSFVFFVWKQGFLVFIDSLSSSSIDLKCQSEGSFNFKRAIQAGK